MSNWQKRWENVAISFLMDRFVCWPLALGQGRHWFIRLLLAPVVFMWVPPALAIVGIPILTLFFISIFRDWGEDRTEPKEQRRG